MLVLFWFFVLFFVVVMFSFACFAPVKTETDWEDCLQNDL